MRLRQLFEIGSKIKQAVKLSTPIDITPGNWSWFTGADKQTRTATGEITLSMNDGTQLVKEVEFVANPTSAVTGEPSRVVDSLGREYKSVDIAFSVDNAIESRAEYNVTISETVAVFKMISGMFSEYWQQHSEEIGQLTFSAIIHRPLDLPKNLPTPTEDARSRLYDRFVNHFVESTGWKLTKKLRPFASFTKEGVTVEYKVTRPGFTDIGNNSSTPDK